MAGLRRALLNRALFPWMQSPRRTGSGAMFAWLDSASCRGTFDPPQFTHYPIVAMAILAKLHHVTRYLYDRPVSLGPQVIRLRPAPHSRTAIQSYSLKVVPEQHFVNWQQDPHGNWLARFVFPEKTTEFSITVDLIADMAVVNPFDLLHRELCGDLPVRLRAGARGGTRALSDPRTDGRGFRALPGGSPAGAGPDDQLPRRPEPEAPSRTSATSFAWSRRADARRDAGARLRLLPRFGLLLLVQLARRLGLAARFVSGYLIQLTPDLKALDGPAGTDKDFTDLHAGRRSTFPGPAGRADPTSGLLCGEGHIPLAATPHYRSAAPISGRRSGRGLLCLRHAGRPRRRAPACDGAVLGRGLAAAGRARRQGRCRLVPTTSASPGRRADLHLHRRLRGGRVEHGGRRADEARACRCLDPPPARYFRPGRFSPLRPGQVVPGESLPRWTFALYWRRDGKPIWQDEAADRPRECSHPRHDRRRRCFGSGIAEKLGLDGEAALPAFEDPAHWVLKEAELPVNVDALDSKLEDAEARARIARVFERGLTHPSGYVLPIQRWNAAPAKSNWMTEKWKLKRERLFLVPATARSATACRSPRSPTYRRRHTRMWSAPIPGPCPPTSPIRRTSKDGSPSASRGNACATRSAPNRSSRC